MSQIYRNFVKFTAIPFQNHNSISDFHFQFFARRLRLMLKKTKLKTIRDGAFGVVIIKDKLMRLKVFPFNVHLILRSRFFVVLLDLFIESLIYNYSSRSFFGWAHVLVSVNSNKKERTNNLHLLVVSWLLKYWLRRHKSVRKLLRSQYSLFHQRSHPHIWYWLVRRTRCRGSFVMAFNWRMFLLSFVRCYATEHVE